MKSDLAERLLQSLMDWDVPRFAFEVGRLQFLAERKYDEYGQYRPGVKFAENLARWLEQFTPEERDVAYSFVMERLVFVSDVEMGHLIDVAYPDYIEQIFLDYVSSELAVPRWHVRRLKDDPAFASVRRRSLFLGMSDGARLDRLRRSCQLSHEQFSQDYTISDEQLERMREELERALKEQDLIGDPAFQHIFLVDDFSGSGRTIIRWGDEEGLVKGKAHRFNNRLQELLSEGEAFAEDPQVTILLYVASEQAEDHVRRMLDATGLGHWNVVVVQRIARSSRVDRTDPNMAELCIEYFDPATVDTHKDRAPIGYSDCALPLVLSHNTPNNSVCLLWAESPEQSDLDRRALFPRYERHHKDRP